MHTYKFNPKQLPTFKYIATLNGDVSEFQGNNIINGVPTLNLKTVVDRLVDCGHKWTGFTPDDGTLGSEYVQFTHKSENAFLSIVNCKDRFIVVLHMHEMGNQSEGHTCFTFKQIKDVFDSVPYCN